MFQHFFHSFHFDNAIKQMAKKYFYMKYFTVRSAESQNIDMKLVYTQTAFSFWKPTDIT